MNTPPTSRDRTRRFQRTALATLTAAGMIASATVAGAAPKKAKKDDPGKGHQAEASYPADGDFTDHWSREDALSIELTDDNTLPLRDENPVDIISDEVWIWDSWPLTGLDTKTESVKGWDILFSLTADRDLEFPNRHWTAEIGYSISKDGKSWEYQGDLFPEEIDPPGQREWAGSALLIDDKLYAFYTASGTEGAEPGEPEYMRQRLAYATADLDVSKDGVSFTNWSDHEILAEADGEHYQTLEQSVGTGIIYGFRDPWVFRNPDDGEIYMLFEGNTAGSYVECENEAAESFNGNVGIAAATSDDLSEWELLPPLLEANCVNQQLERPHATFRGGDVYLWTISHKFTFAPDLTGAARTGLPDGLYGFVGPSIRSDYEPLNGSGLALANPPENNTQDYSWYVMPGFFVESFMDNVEGEYIGTLAPTVKLNVDGQNDTRIGHIYDSPFIK